MTEPTVFIVDDDEAVRDSLAILLETAGYNVRCHDSAVSFLAALASSDHGCVVADVRMPGMDGIELQETLAERRSALPVIIMTGHGDVPLAVRAMKAGAVDFLQKPFEEDAMVEQVRRALDRGERLRLQDRQAAGVRERIDALTPREREVLDRLVAGDPNKMIAFRLGISPRTVEIHRARVMEKMQAHNLSELVRMMLTAGA